MPSRPSPANVRNWREWKHQGWFCCGYRCPLLPGTSAVSPPPSVFAFLLLVFIRLLFFWVHLFALDSWLPAYIPPPSFFIFVYFCLIPITPLGSHLHQCHSFLSQSRSLHTKLPICTLPALSGVHGRSGPAEHAAADGNSPDLCPARPLPASSHRVSARLPRWGPADAAPHLLLTAGPPGPWYPQFAGITELEGPSPASASLETRGLKPQHQVVFLPTLLVSWSLASCL